MKFAVCPICGKEKRQGKAMQHHLRDKHQETGMGAHLAANPNDRQAAKSMTGRRSRHVPKKPKPKINQDPDDFDVLEDF